MTKSRYCFALNITAWLFLCISLLFFYLWSTMPLIIFAVLAMGLAVFLGVAAVWAFNGKGFLLSHICIASTSGVTFAYWLFRIIAESSANAVFPMLISLLPCGAYFLGISLRRKENDLAPFFYKSVIFFSFVLFFASGMPIENYFGTFSVLPLSLNLYTLIAAVLGLLAYALFYSGRLNKTISAVFVGVDAGLAFIVSILNTIDWDIFMMVGLLLIVSLLTAGFYLLAFSKAGKKLLGNDSPKTPALLKKSDGGNWISQIENLYKLHEAGILTDDEYQTQKDKILGGHNNV